MNSAGALHTVAAVKFDDRRPLSQGSGGERGRTRSLQSGLNDQKLSGLSRRSFLRGAAGVTVGASTIGSGLQQAAVAAARDKVAPLAAVATRPTPPWFDEAKLGIFIHWNAASIPAFANVILREDLPGDIFSGPGWQQQQFWRLNPYAEMYQNTMLVPDSEAGRNQAENFGNRPYDDFVSEFRSSTLRRWRPGPWAKLFAESGAGYVVLTTKTEDGFLLWPSDTRNPNKSGWQAERDVVGELASAVRAKGLRFGTYYAGGIDWSFQGLPITDVASLLQALELGDDYRAYADAHWRELIARYKPSVLWNDYGFLPNPDAGPLFETYFNDVSDGVVNDRFDPEAQTSGQLQLDYTTVEYSTDYPAEGKWEATRGMGTSFGFNRLESEESYLSGTELIHLFVDIVAQGGNLLINVGPTSRGEIPKAQEERLSTMGRWLRTNGAAIYKTRPWGRAKGITGDALQIRYTDSGDAIHAVILGEPRTNSVDIDVQLDANAKVSLNGSQGTLSSTRTPHGTRVTLPRRSADESGFSLRLSPASAVHDPS